MVVSRKSNVLFAAGALLVSTTSATSLEQREGQQPNTLIRRQRRHHAMRRENNTTVAARREDAAQLDERGLLGDTLNGVGQLVGGILGIPPKTTQASAPSAQPTQQPSNPNPSPSPNPNPAPAPSPSPPASGGNTGGNTGGGNNGGGDNTGGNTGGGGNNPAQPAHSSTGGTNNNNNNGNGNAPNNNVNDASSGNPSPVQAFVAGQTSLASPDDAALASAAATLGGQAGALQSVTVTQGTRIFTAAMFNPTFSSDLPGTVNVDTNGNPTSNQSDAKKKNGGGSNVAVPIAVTVALVVLAVIGALIVRKRRANRRNRPSEYAGYGRARRNNSANKALSGDSWLAGRQTAYYTDADPAATFQSTTLDTDLTQPAMREQQQPEMSERPLSSFGEADLTGTGAYRPESGLTIRMPASQSQQTRGLYQLNNSTPGSRRTFFDTYQSEQDDAMWSAESHSNSRHSDGLFYDGSATTGYSNAAARGMDEAGAEHAGVPSPYRDVQRGSTFGGDHETHSNRSSASVLPYDNRVNYRHADAARRSTRVSAALTTASAVTSRYSHASEQSAAPSVFSASADHGEALMMSDDPFNVVADNQNSSMDFDDGATTIQQPTSQSHPRLPQHPLSPKDFSRNPDASRWSG